MNRLSAFFKGRDTHLGLFYPEHYLLAVFPNLVQADRAQEKLRHAGCGEEDVRARIASQRFGGCFNDSCFARTSGSQERKVSNRASG